MFDRIVAARPRREAQRGQVLVLFTILLVVLLLASALAVDYGSWLVSKRSYQNVADAAALAGAQQLTRSLDSGKRSLARQAAWQSVKSALSLTSLDPATQAAASQSTAYVENGYSIWVASPPSSANTGCSSNCPYPGHVSGPGVVFVRVQRTGQHFLSRIVFSSDTPVIAWATAGRFPRNFAVEAMCDPNAGGGNCITQGANIKIDGSNSALIVSTGDLGTNSWTRTSGSTSTVALGTDSHAYEGSFEDCWNAGGNQCNLYGYSGGAADYTDLRSADPLGAQIVDPGYAAPTTNSTTTPNECRGTGTVQLASILESGTDSHVADTAAGARPVPDVVPAAVRLPPTQAPVLLGVGVKVSGTVSWGGTGVNGMTVTLLTSPGGAIAQSTTTSGGGPNAGGYSFSGVAAGSYTINVTDPSATPTYHGGTAGPFAVAGSNVTQNIVITKNPVIGGTVKNASTLATISGANITITGAGGGSWTGVTNGSGVYSIIVTTSDTFTVSASAAGYVTNSGTTGGVVNFNGTPTVNVNLTPSPASLTGTITDSVTGLPIPGITVTLTPGGSSQTTDTSGHYNFGSIGQGTYTATLAGTSLPSTVWGSGTTIDGYLTAAPSSPATPLANLVVSGATTQNFSLWPKGCSSNAGNYGSYSCSYPSGSNCPNTTNTDAANVTCTFTQANAIRPGTYNNISINGCAWIDPKGGVTGLASGQMAGIVHVKGTISLSNNSYLFGDGVTIVMDQGSNIDVNNGGGFVLNYGSLHSTPSNASTSCDLTSVKAYGDGYSPCFRTTPSTDTQDYAYAAWTTAGMSPWQSNSGSGCVQASTPVYNTTTSASRCVTPGTDLGITFYLYGSGKGNASRIKISTANMGYLFNGVLYGPNDDIQLGGGKDGQTAAGQIIGYTIEYHGGTKILQNWYADPADGPPFLIEPVLGECVLPVGA
jgi:Putative Flp pilus-assembly TadE/G-like/SdrD B-like domain